MNTSGSSPVQQLQSFLERHPPQLDNLWEFSISGGTPDYLDPDFKLLVSDVTIPFPKLLYETSPTGEKYYTGIQYPNEFSVTVRETHKPGNSVQQQPLVMTWFNKWFNEVYSFSSPDEIFQDPLTACRTGTLSLMTHNVLLSKVHDPIIQPVIVDNILLAIGRLVVGNAAQKVANIGNLVSPGSFNTSVIPPAIVPMYIGSAVTTVLSEEKTVESFTFVNLRPVGIEPVSLSYTDGKPMEYRIAMVCDRLRTKNSDPAAPLGF
jgi:hypothetical protein